MYESLTFTRFDPHLGVSFMVLFRSLSDVSCNDEWQQKRSFGTNVMLPPVCAILMDGFVFKLNGPP